MQIGRIKGATLDLGKPKDWDEEKHGICSSLPVRVENNGDLPEMVSAWFPTPEELKKLIRGAPVHLAVVGVSHPPVLLTVGDVPQ